jgi:hypothetical protein
MTRFGAMLDWEVVEAETQVAWDGWMRDEGHSSHRTSREDATFGGSSGLTVGDRAFTQANSMFSRQTNRTHPASVHTTTGRLKHLTAHRAHTLPQHVWQPFSQTSAQQAG